MAAEKHGSTLAERSGDLVAQLPRTDQADVLEQGYAVHKHASRVVQHLQLLTDLTQRDARWRVNVGHGSDVWSRSVDPSVNPQFGVRLALTLALIAVEVEHQQPRRVRQRWTGARWEQERVGPRQPGANVPKGRNQSRGVHDAVRQRHVAT